MQTLDRALPASDEQANRERTTGRSGRMESTTVRNAAIRKWRCESRRLQPAAPTDNPPPSAAALRHRDVNMPPLLQSKGRRAGRCSRLILAVLLTIGDQVQNRRACDGNAPRDAVMARPRPVAILQVQDFLRRIGTPLLPFFTAGSLQAIADVEIREELFAPDGSEAVQKLLIGDLGLDLLNLLRVLLPV